MAIAELSRRVEKVVGDPPLCEMNSGHRREFHEALLGRTASRICPFKGPGERFVTRDVRRDASRQAREAVAKCR